MKIDDIAAAVGLHSADDAELLRLMLTEEGLAPDATAIPRRRPGEPLELSHGQLRLWFLERLLPGTPVYNIPAAVALRAPVDVALLERAVNEVVRRHSVLRSSFPEEDGRPRVIVTADLHVPVVVVDLDDLPVAEQDAMAQRLVQEEVHRPFDIGRGPLIRCKLIRWHSTVSVLTVTMHHTISDAWSMGIFIREIWRLCEAFACGRPSPLEELPIQYTDFATWQRERVRGASSQRELEYWQSKLRPPLPLLDLPADRRRPESPSFRGGRAVEELPQDLHTRLLGLARSLNVTPFVLLLAAFKALMSRYTGLDDIVVGSAVAGRSHREVESLIGFFVNMLALRTSLAGNPEFSEIVSRVRATSLDAWANQELPFEVLVQSLGIERRLNRAPLFQVVFLFQEDEFISGEGPGMPVARWPVQAGRARFDLMMYVVQSERGFRMEVEYSQDLFDDDRIRRMLGHFEMILRTAVDRFDCRLSDLRLLSADEWSFVVSRRGASPNRGSTHAPVHTRFERQCAYKPGATAVVIPSSPRRSVTYRSLNLRAERLVQPLRELGVGPNVTVGLLLERSLDMVASLLAVLKAGGAYLPLDPALPPARLASMVDDSGTRVLVSHRNLHFRLPGHRAKLLLLDSRGRPNPTGRSTVPLPNLSPRNLAYVVYTSGSTGEPKGVPIHHAALDNLLHAFREAIAMSERDRLLAVTSLSFDIATLEILLPLVSGATLVLAGTEDARDPRWLASALEKHAITAMQATPSRWRSLVEMGWAGKPGLKMISGGEALSPSLADALVERGACLWNAYGPSETCIWSMVDKVDRSDGVTIGTPIADTQVYVLDGAARPVPVGIPGQLHIGGAGLSEGYRGRPRLTAERFSPDPFGVPGGRIYATGDLVQLRTDGRVDFLGRIDNQVKIRGYRVEPEEVERALERHPNVRRSAVVAQEGGDSRRLEAYIELEPGAQASGDQLRAFLSETLPEYMVPSRFRAVDRLPLNSNGKLDRTALLHDEPGAELVGSDTQPRSATEEVLLALWSNLLELETIGVDDNFFAVGGHSLLATQLIARVHEAFDVELPLVAVFESPTISLLAAVIDERLRTPAASDAPPVTARALEAEPALSSDQQQIWRVDRGLGGAPLFALTSAVPIAAAIDGNLLQQTIDRLMERHEPLRARFLEIDEQPVQRFDAPPAVVQVYDLRGLATDSAWDEAVRLVAFERHRPFDLRSGPPLRVLLLLVGTEDSIVLVSLHHLAGDAWSMGIVMREIEALYRGFVEGEPSRLPPPPFQFADFVLWQRARHKDLFPPQRAYWLNKLKGLHRFEPPLDRPRASELAMETSRVRRVLDSTQANRLSRLASQRGATPFMAVLTGFMLLMARRTGSPDVRVATLVANRERAGTDQVVGLFINTVILRTDLSGNCDFDEALRRVRLTVLEAVAHQDLPFEDLAPDLESAGEIQPADIARVLFTRRPRVPFLDQLNGDPTSASDTSARLLGGLEMTATTYDLVVDSDAMPDWIVVEAKFKTALFDTATIERLLDELVEILDNWTALTGALAEPIE